MSQKRKPGELAKLTRDKILEQFELSGEWTRQELVDKLLSEETSEKQISYAIRILRSYNIIREKANLGGKMSVTIYERVAKSKKESKRRLYNIQKRDTMLCTEDGK